MKLRKKLEGLEINESGMALLQEYFQLEFNMMAANLPAIYRMGMADGIRLLRILNLL